MTNETPFQIYKNILHVSDELISLVPHLILGVIEDLVAGIMMQSYRARVYALERIAGGAGQISPEKLAEILPSALREEKKRRRGIRDKKTLERSKGIVEDINGGKTSYEKWVEDEKRRGYDSSYDEDETEW